MATTGGPQLERALASITAQTDERWECLVVDHGPTGVVSARIPAGDTRFRLVPHEGPPTRAAAFATGLARTTTPLVVLLDEVDELFPDRLAVGIAALADPVATTAIGHAVGAEGDEAPAPRGGDRRADVLRSLPPRFGQLLLRRDGMAPIDVEMRTDEDVAWWFAMRDRAVLVATDEVLCRLGPPAVAPEVAAEQAFAARRRLLDRHADLLAADHDARAFHRGRAAEAARRSGRRGQAVLLALAGFLDRPRLAALGELARSAAPARVAGIRPRPRYGSLRARRPTTVEGPVG